MSTAAGHAGSRSILDRPRLRARLEEAFGKRLTTVVAGPGFGKSTLLRAWCSDIEHVWLSLRPAEAHFDRMAPALITTLGRYLPPPAADAARRAAHGASDPTLRAEIVAGLLCEPLRTTLSHDAVLVLDDAHELPAGSEAARLVESVCRQAPPPLHIVIAARTLPPIRLQRLRGQRDVLELTGVELAFTLDEVEVLVENAFGGGHARFARALHKVTAGWPAAVGLALEAARTTPSREDRMADLDRLSRRDGPLYEYLAEEVFDAEAPAVRELLRCCAPFDAVCPELCEALGLPASAAILEDLAHRGLAQRQDGEWYALHTLVREFASRAWALSDKEVTRHRLLAADWYASRGAYDEELAELVAAGAIDRVVRVLEKRGDQLLLRSGPEAVLRLEALLNRRRLGEAVEQLLGEAHMLRGEMLLALRRFRRAARDRTRIPPALAWRLVAAHYFQDNLEDAVAAARRADFRHAGVEDRALLDGWAASAERRLGRTTQAKRRAQRALAAAEKSGNDRALALAHTALALLESAAEGEADSHLVAALVAAERAGDSFQRARIHNNVGSRLLERGAYDEAVEQLGAAIQLAELGGFKSLLALATMNRGLCNWCRGRLDEASADYDAAVAFYRQMGSREAAYALIGRGDVHRERGELAQARAAYEEGLVLGEQANDRQALVPGLYQLAKVIVNDEPERAEVLARRAVDYGWPDLAWALNALGWVLLARDDRPAAAGAGASAAKAAGELADPFGLAESLELLALTTDSPSLRRELLDEALAVWKRLGNVVHEAAVEFALAGSGSGAKARRSAAACERRLAALGVRVSASGPAGLLRFVARRPTAALRIETLGGFRVIADGRHVQQSAWRSKKARDLLQILVSRRGRPCPRELLMETLWPDEDPAKLAHRLSVAVSALRTVLDPHRHLAPDHFVAGDRGSFWVDLDQVALDVDDFLAEAAAGLAARRGDADRAPELLLSAEALYGGEFLEQVYEDWAVSLREEARAVYLDVLRALAADARAAGDEDAAARFLLRILECDPFDERAHLELVRARTDGGRHGDARRAYRGYCARMDEIGVEAAPYPRSV